MFGFSTVRDLYYLASEAAYIPVRLAQALGEGIALGWRTCNAQDAGTTITRGFVTREEWEASCAAVGYREHFVTDAERLADAEAEREVWEPAGVYLGMPQADWERALLNHNSETSLPDDIGSQDGIKWITTDALPPHVPGVIFHSDIFKTSSTDGEVSADPPVDERPSANSGILPPVAEGHPRLHWVAAWGLREWLAGEPCTAPTYFRSIADDLEQFSK